ncbi:acidic proline-rich protein, putative [Trichomonas vaginalis G3]|uniref:Acidic proline-rich protein, putative n=1 Tax=Trichomonas vaginalis (strain ATCC PRA-98 / G3) TaxID=412133 RepID=A2GKW2_TRIV3|nr:acidic proline-rich protein, putative [Trichomonas vaginalis G3]|eukprot:XP_001295134.1 acidic proline-rich protein [Trichomonas vaginalis G3]
MSHVPPTQSIPKPEEPKEPQQSPQQAQFQQVPPPNYYQFPPQGYYPPQGFPNYPPLPMPYFPNPWMFQQAPPQQFQSQSKSKRDQEFEEGLNRLRKDYATAPIERKLFPDQKYNLGEEVRSHLFFHLFFHLMNLS